MANNNIFKTQIIHQVDDAFNYFKGYRLEELKQDDVYYINAFMKYIELLESKLTKQSKVIDYLQNN